MYLGKSKETLDITMGGTLESEVVGDKEPKPNQPLSAGDNGKGSPMKASEDSPAKPLEKPISEQSNSQRPTTGSGWLGGWLGRPNVQPSNAPNNAPGTVKDPEEEPIKEPEAPQPEPQTSSPAEDVKPAAAPTNSTSWFGLWSTAAPSTVEEPPKEQLPVKITAAEEDTVMEDTPLPKVTGPAAGSSWAFWSTDTSKKAVALSGKPGELGQLAIAGEPSQDHPEPAKAVTVKDNKKVKSTKRGRPQSVEVDESSRKATQLDPISTKGTPSQSPAPAKSLPPNLLIPSVKKTYRLVENPSILQQIARLLLQGHQQPMKHVSLVKDAPKIKKALAIGIHGLFPAPLLRTVIGQPTGTSIKFANHAAEAIRRWTDSHGSIDCEIEKVALEGEGKIAERVDNLWKLLLNWIDHVRKADFIMIACHSQGVPVAVMLVAKLIEFGVVSNGRIGVCAMGKSFVNFIFSMHVHVGHVLPVAPGPHQI
jgi:hypothetical protein